MRREPAEPLGEIGQIAIAVSDVVSATAFYRDVLGRKFLFSAGPTLAFFAAGSVRLMLSAEDDNFRARRNSIIYFQSAKSRCDLCRDRGSRRGCGGGAATHRADARP